MSSKYEVGSKVYFVKTCREIYWWLYSKTPPKPLKHPIEKKITQIVTTREDTLYQVKDGHFPESWIGSIVFNSKEDAENAIRNRDTT